MLPKQLKYGSQVESAPLKVQGSILLQLMVQMVII